MKYLFVIGVLLILGVVGYVFLPSYIGSRNVVEPTEEVGIPEEVDSIDTESEGNTEELSVSEALKNLPLTEVVLENLTIPWEIVFLNDEEFLASERDGTIVRFNMQTKDIVNINVDDVLHQGEGGLLGMALHPEFDNNQQLYLYLTSTLGEDSNASVNEVVRYRLVNNQLVDRTPVIENIPGSLYHNGGRIAFGPDDLLYVTTGDARESENAQNLGSLAGKILRVTPDGKVPLNSPFNTLVYAYGSRNAQGLTWDNEKNLWSTEHGRTNLTETGMDEINLIVAGGNYGWPESEGDTVFENTRRPKLHSGPNTTWAPGGALYWDGSLFFGGLKGEALYEAVLNGTDVVELKEHFKGEFGRIRTVTLGPDGAFYITTSNRDNRGDVAEGDDKIIRINPLQFRE